jgi:hypothetical protein
MPTITLLQKSEFSLVGIRLAHGDNELTDEQFETLSKEWGYTHAVEHGLIAPQETDSPSEKESAKKPKK